MYDEKTVTIFKLIRDISGVSDMDRESTPRKSRVLSASSSIMESGKKGKNRKMAYSEKKPTR
jgi:hypothetical protein